MYCEMKFLNARVIDWSMTIIDYMQSAKGGVTKTLGLVPFRAHSSSRG
jgi:hypothetical protein